MLNFATFFKMALTDADRLAGSDSQFGYAAALGTLKGAVHAFLDRACPYCGIASAEYASDKLCRTCIKAHSPLCVYCHFQEHGKEPAASVPVFVCVEHMHPDHPDVLAFEQRVA